MAEKGQPLPKFGEWDVNDPTSAEGFTYIFNEARNEKKTGGHEMPAKNAAKFKKGGGTATLGKPQSGTSANSWKAYDYYLACMACQFLLELSAYMSLSIFGRCVSIALHFLCALVELLLGNIASS